MKMKILSFLVDIITIVVSSVAIMILWNWFMIPVFPTVPELNFATACGLGFLSSVLVSSGKSYDFTVGDEEFVFNVFMNQVMSGIAKPIIIVICGGILRFLLF
jgi:hypothetical protein